MEKTADKKTLFVDTNILAYISLTHSPFHTDARNKLNHYVQNGYELWISRQIIREYLVVMSRSLSDQGSYDATRLVSDTRKLKAQFNIADDTDAVSEELLDLIGKYNVMGKPVHDCSIIATMKICGLTELLTNNAADFKRYQEGITVIPLI